MVYSLTDLITGTFPEKLIGIFSWGNSFVPSSWVQAPNNKVAARKIAIQLFHPYAFCFSIHVSFSILLYVRAFFDRSDREETFNPVRSVSFHSQYVSCFGCKRKLFLYINIRVAIISPTFHIILHRNLNGIHLDSQYVGMFRSFLERIFR